MKVPAFDERTFLRFFGTLDERQARLCAAERALVLGRGGIAHLARVTGLSRQTVRTGIAELRGASGLATGRIRRAGGWAGAGARGGGGGEKAGRGGRPGAAGGAGRAGGGAHGGQSDGRPALDVEVDRELGGRAGGGRPSR